MTVQELLEAIDREAERALVGYPLDLKAEIEIVGAVTMVGGQGHYEHTVTGVARRIERNGSRFILHFTES